MIADRIRASILQAAISGKLTDQRTEDGTATELLKKIAAERAQLVKEKKLKKQKVIPVVDAGDCSFELPDGWEWCRLSDVVITNPSVSGDDSAPVGFLPMASIEDGYTGMIHPERRKWAEVKSGFTKFAEGDVVLAKITPCFQNKKSAVVRQLGSPYGAGTTELHVLRPSPGLDADYLLFFLKSEYVQSDLTPKMTGTAGQKRVPLSALSELLFPLPPLVEQERIIAKLDEVLPLIDHLAELEREREHLDSEFAQAIERAILQAAISGKLTDQLSEDGTAAELLETIQAERQQLEKEGKIKKQKPLPPVGKADEPFELPDSWDWSRLGHVFNMQAGKNIAVGNISEVGDYPCYGGNGIRGYVADYNRDGTYPLIGRQGALCGNINVASGRFFATEHAVAVETFGETSPTWAALALEQLNLNQYATATAQPGLSVEKLRIVPVPIPPTAEQRRIASVVEASRNLTDDIKELVL